MNLCDVSVIVTTCDEEANIARCLDKLDGFGEIIVVDSFSTDRTLDIIRSYAAAAYVRPYHSAAQQKNWALDCVRNDWVLILDADESLSSGLTNEIRGLNDNDARDGYWMFRESHYLGSPIRRCGWQRDKVLRLFKRSRGRYEEKAVHEEVALRGTAGILKNKLQHYPYRVLEQHFDKINEYSSRGARDYLDRGGRIPLLRMLFNPPFRFLRMYVLQRGFLDGSKGFILCLMSAYSVFLKYAKAWERKICRDAS
ncbi:MAG: glycosyltransferase family 2 protein [Candidatus Krumholzibacteria bacterium]|nr:glycosyltransferase family 2 protein [Candidatus Krumholzibacteria bacterium]